MPADESATSLSWYRRFTGTLDPGERLGEVLFGLIMVLTFTLGAGIGLAGDRASTRSLLIAVLGCNTAWGIIDAMMFLLNRLSERGRIHRMAMRLQAAANLEEALAWVTKELDDRVPEFVKPEIRAALDRDVLAQLRNRKVEPSRVVAADLWGALAVFWLVFIAALPAALPFLVIGDAQIAMRTSNAVLILLLFHVGWRWAGYTGASRWGMGLLMLLLGVGLVGVAIALGG